MDDINNSLPAEQEDWDEDEDYDEEDDDADIDAEALEIARRLGEQLWADISKVTAEQNSTHNVNTEPAVSGSMPVHGSVGVASNSLPNATPRKEEAAIGTMKAILALVGNDPLAKSALLSTTIPNGPNIFELLSQCAASGTISRGISGPLSQVIVTLARSSELFGNLKQSNASAIQLDKGKRKREEGYDEAHYHYPHPFKRPYVPDFDLQNQVVEAVRVISHALGTSSQGLDPSLVSSIRLQLHQVFLFAVTSAAAAGPSMHALQEIGGLIQVIGVLSGIQIGHSPDGHGQSFSQSPDIGTAVYPCLIIGCHKTFSRLYSLRAHQRSHSTHRPYRCSVCPASFARNHDLKRHIKLHDKKAWKCEGCHKIFSRRDAIKRHKTGTKSRGPKSEICLAAEIIEVQLEGEEGEDALREERRAKLWNGIVVSESSGISSSSTQNMYRDANTVDEGEINPAAIAGIQGSVLGLHPLLQSLVGNALGTPIHPPTAPLDPSAGQATLASVIARAQSQAVPPSTFTTSASSVPLAPAQIPEEINEDFPMADGNAPPAQPGGEDVQTQQPLPSLSMYGLSDEQAQLLEIAIATAASAAQAQAEAEAALEEEEEEDYDQDDNEYDESEVEQDMEPAP
ncbi:hypothetical protein CPC08DRAFT_655303 [Agrocybe pediades]|nr:hypothetical protein CPC08DRAFT_655303 [Agrocybe pediades]